jgi:hypothetical protein
LLFGTTASFSRAWLELTTPNEFDPESWDSVEIMFSPERAASLLLCALRTARVCLGANQERTGQPARQCDFLEEES